ncbi:hypothetical protein ACWEN3_16855 [Streptomyces sp. NPDC004561]
MAVEIVDAATERVRRLSCTAGREHDLSLGAGAYLVRVTAPGHSSVAEMVTVRDGSRPTWTVTLPPAAGASAQTDSSGPAPSYEPPAYLVAGESVASVVAEARAEAVQVSFLCDDRQVTSVVAPGTPAAGGDEEHAGRPGLFLGRVGPGAAARFTSFPAGTRLHRDPPDAEPVVLLDDRDAQGLLTFVTHGQTAAAAIVWPDVAARVNARIQAGHASAVAACVLGHHQLDSADHALETEELIRRFPADPDVDVLHGWSILREGGPHTEDARRALVRAADPRSGLPSLTQGLRLLRLALARLEQSDSDQGIWDPQVTRALFTTDRYLTAADWTAPLTTFTGDSPLLPHVDEEDHEGGQSEDEFTTDRSDEALVGVVTRSGDDVRVAPSRRDLAVPAGMPGLTLLPRTTLASAPAIHVPPRQERYAASTGEPRQSVTSGPLTYTARRLLDARAAQAMWSWHLSVQLRDERLAGMWAVLAWRPQQDPEGRYRTFVLPMHWDPVLRQASCALWLDEPAKVLDWYVACRPVDELPRRGRRTLLQRSLSQAADRVTRRALSAALDEEV